MRNYAEMTEEQIILLLPRINDQKELRVVKAKGIICGNPEIVYEACKKLDAMPSKGELFLTLRHAVGKHGWSIDDKNTTVGKLYQDLFGRDYEPLATPLSSMNPYEKEEYFKKVCRVHGIEALN